MTAYHVHVTMFSPLSEPPPRGWKATTIVLIGKRQQTDFMLTKHYVTGHKGIELLQDIFDDVKKLAIKENIDRIKVEQTSHFNLPINELNYIEVHLKCKAGTMLLNTNWVKSTNPSEKKNGELLFFYNRRIYSGISHESVFSQIDAEIGDIPFIEKKIEQVVFDSNRSVDKWWA